MARTLGIDYGRVRVGFAVSDELGIISTPLDVATVTGMTQAVAATTDRLRQTDATEVVVGQPLNMDGSESELSREVELFIDKLKQETDVPIHQWDERMTSMQAERVLIEGNVSREKRKKVKDKLAAQLILQSYLDSISF
ncbi:MAG: Holliday junction resolvase RuvX [Verrucomicrobia bacterium]|nr:Holliday junction resolvase RuvX [Verrucomicrobiota bacterium]MDA1086249.1 Holliday junction resolvase RuvX [Verrucomicrobiota bacterium]